MGGVGTISSGSIASAEQQYALRWNDFHSSILSSFRHLRDEEDFIDVTIACDGCSFTAHKVVLSACSPFFRSLLKANPCQHPIVILRDVREQDMEALLRFMYNGEVHIGQEQMSDFLKTAQTLQVRGLADVSTKDSGKSSTGTTATSGITNNIPWDVDGTHNTSNNNNLDTQGPPLKKSRTTDHHHNSRYTDASPHVNASNDNDAQGQHPLNDTTMTLSERSHSTSNQVKGLDGPIQLHSSNDDDSNSFDDEPSDTECTDRGGSSIDLMQPKLEHSDYSYSERSRNDSILSPMFDPQRQRTGYASGLFNLQGIAAGLIPGPSGLHNNSQEAYGSSGGGAVHQGGVAEPKPICKECGRIYSSISNLKQHVANVHSTSNAWEPCTICGKHFKTRQYLFNHLLQTHGIRQRGTRMSIPSSSHPPGSSTNTHPSTNSSSTMSSSFSQSIISTALSLPVLPGPSASFVTIPIPPPPSQPALLSSNRHTTHSPLHIERSVPHHASNDAPSKKTEISSAVEQCLQYLIYPARQNELSRAE